MARRFGSAMISNTDLISFIYSQWHIRVKACTGKNGFTYPVFRFGLCPFHPRRLFWVNQIANTLNTVEARLQGSRDNDQLRPH